MRCLATRLSGPALLEPDVHRDARGFFLETFRCSSLAQAGIPDRWVQDNHSRSRRGTVRGLHFQPGMAKMIRCVRGSIFDVLVDIRRDSSTFGEWESFELDDERLLQVYCPDGFAHGFCVVSETADVTYRCSDYYDAARDQAIRYDDPEIGVSWPKMHHRVSQRDASAPALGDLPHRAD